MQDLVRAPTQEELGFVGGQKPKYTTSYFESYTRCLSYYPFRMTNPRGSDSYALHDPLIYLLYLICKQGSSDRIRRTQIWAMQRHLAHSMGNCHLQLCRCLASARTCGAFLRWILILCRTATWLLEASGVPGLSMVFFLV